MCVYITAVLMCVFIYTYICRYIHKYFCCFSKYCYMEKLNLSQISCQLDINKANSNILL